MVKEELKKILAVSVIALDLSRIEMTTGTGIISKNTETIIAFLKKLLPEDRKTVEVAEK